MYIYLSAVFLQLLLLLSSQVFDYFGYKLEAGNFFIPFFMFKDVLHKIEEH